MSANDLTAGATDTFRAGDNFRWRRLAQDCEDAFPGRASTVLEPGALSDFDDVTIRIADVAANLAIFGNRRREELGSSTFPQFVARLNIRHAEIHKAVDVIWVGGAERYRRLIRGRPAPNVQNHPDIRKLQVRGRVAVTHGQNASAERGANSHLPPKAAIKQRCAEPGFRTPRLWSCCFPRGDVASFLLETKTSPRRENA